MVFLLPTRRLQPLSAVPTSFQQSSGTCLDHRCDCARARKVSFPQDPGRGSQKFAWRERSEREKDTWTLETRMG
jgi:hypothetical protein